MNRRTQVITVTAVWIICLLGVAAASLALMAGTSLRAQPYSNAVMSLSPPPVAYWPLQETTQPPAPGLNIDTNSNFFSPGIIKATLGRCGRIDELFFRKRKCYAPQPLAWPRYDRGDVKPVAGLGDDGGEELRRHRKPAAAGPGQ